MTIKFSKNAIKFLEKLTEKDKEKIRLKIKVLATSIEEGILPFRKMDIKKWKEIGKVL